MISTTRLASGALAVLASVFLLAGTASAQTVTPPPPAPATTDCTTLINGTTEVQNAQNAVTAAKATVANDVKAVQAAVGQQSTDSGLLVQLQNASQAVTSTGTPPLPTDTLVTPINGITTLTGLTAKISSLQGLLAPTGADTAAVNKAQAQLNTDKGKLTTAQNDLTGALNHQTGLLCTGTPVAATTPTSSTTPAPPADCTAISDEQAKVNAAQGTVDRDNQVKLDAIAKEGADQAAGAAQSVIDTDQTAVNNADLALTNAQGALTAAKNALQGAVEKAQRDGVNCTPVVIVPPTGGTISQLPPVTVGSVLTEINVLACPTYGDQLAAIQADEIRLVQAGASNDDAVKVSDALKAKEAQLNCAGTAAGSSTTTTPGSSTSTVTVTPGSGTAATGSAQVPTVPNTTAGVNTGGW